MSTVLVKIDIARDRENPSGFHSIVYAHETVRFSSFQITHIVLCSISYASSRSLNPDHTINFELPLRERQQTSSGEHFLVYNSSSLIIFGNVELIL